MREPPTSERTSAGDEMDQPASYREAEEELEAILTRLEADEVDVDELSTQVARARQLITWCRGRLAQAEVSITELLADDDR